MVINTGSNTRFSSVVSRVALVLLIIMVSLFRHEDFLEIARFALVLTIAAIPVALPTVLGGHEQTELLELAALASKLENNDPVELAIITTSKKTCPIST